jgi:hypothetical protein
MNPLVWLSLCPSKAPVIALPSENVTNRNSLSKTLKSSPTRISWNRISGESIALTLMQLHGQYWEKEQMELMCSRELVRQFPVYETYAHLI